MLQVNGFEPGDGTHYRYLIERGTNDYGKDRLFFGFGVGSKAIVVGEFVADDHPDFYYFQQQMSALGDNPHTMVVAYLLFSALVGERAWHLPEYAEGIEDRIGYCLSQVNLWWVGN